MLIQRRTDGHFDWALYGGTGRVGVVWYFRESTRLRTSAMLYHLEPGAEEGRHFHLEGDPDSCSVESEDELYIVVAGEVVMIVGDESAVLRSGDAVYVPEGVPHGVRNDSGAPADLVLLFGPPDGNPLRQTWPPAEPEMGRSEPGHPEPSLP